MSSWNFNEVIGLYVNEKREIEVVKELYAFETMLAEDISTKLEYEKYRDTVGT